VLKARKVAGLTVTPAAKIKRLAEKNVLLVVDLVEKKDLSIHPAGQLLLRVVRGVNGERNLNVARRANL
jgi:hypothetical protein